jgi:hypothetical protein
MVRAALIVLVLVTSGCIGLAPTDEEIQTNCRAGTGLLLRAQHYPGFITPDYQLMFYTLTRDGVLTYFRANETEQGAAGSGSGRLIVKNGALSNISAAQVRAEMQLVNAWSSQKDFLVSKAFRHTVSAARFDDFCATVLQHFYDYDRRYDNQTIADCDAFEFTITTSRGTHSSYSYCQTGPGHVRESFNKLRDEAWKRFGIAGL